jgi:hypothetical protein
MTVRRFGLVAMVLAMTAATAGCGGDSGGGTDDVESSPSTAPATTVPGPATAAGTTVPPTDLTLRITDVRLVASEEPDRGMRVLLPAGVATASVTLTGLPSPNRVISVCQAPDLDGQVSGARCRTPVSGEPLTFTLGPEAKGVEIIPESTSGTGAGSSVAVEEVTIRYAASSREINVRLPQIASGESGGRPTFGLTPASGDGTYRATLTWAVIQVFGGTPSSGQLELLQGGAVANQSQGGGEVRLSGAVPGPAGDAAIRVQNIGSSALVTPKLTALLP